MQGVIEYLFLKENEYNIIVLPAEVDELMDEEEIDDVKLDAPFIKDIAGKIEVIPPADEYEKMCRSYEYIISMDIPMGML